MAGIILVLALVIGLPCVRFGIFPKAPAGGGKIVRIFEFKEGCTLKKIAEELEHSKIISSGDLFILYARLKGADGKIKAGAYLFNDGMTPSTILRKLLAGDVYIRRFAVPEGYSIYQVAELLERRGFLGKGAFLEQCSNRALLSELGIEASSVEGYLYPCTYDLSPQITAADLIRMMVAQFRKHYSRELAARAKTMRMNSSEILTLASIVEKEAKVSGEKPLIASVFLNRLRKKMPLQSDPTAVYKIRAFAGRISKKDIMTDSPYNTYKIKGLPPGPIGNPGKDAIAAVLNPARTKYLYFVAKMDGTHHFSATLAEHNYAVTKYLRSGGVPRESVGGPGLEYRNNFPVIAPHGG